MHSGRRNNGSLPKNRQTANRRELQKIGAVGNCTDGEQTKLEAKYRWQEFQEEITKNAEQFSKLLERIGTTKSDTERDSAGATTA